MQPVACHIRSVGRQPLWRAGEPNIPQPTLVHLCVVVHAVRICQQAPLAIAQCDEATAGAGDLALALPW